MPAVVQKMEKVDVWGRPIVQPVAIVHSVHIVTVVEVAGSVEVALIRIHLLKVERDLHLPQIPLSEVGMDRFLSGPVFLCGVKSKSILTALMLDL